MYIHISLHMYRDMGVCMYALGVTLYQDALFVDNSLCVVITLQETAIYSFKFVALSA